MARTLGLETKRVIRHATHLERPSLDAHPREFNLLRATSVWSSRHKHDRQDDNEKDELHSALPDPRLPLNLPADRIHHPTGISTGHHRPSLWIHQNSLHVSKLPLMCDLDDVPHSFEVVYHLWVDTSLKTNRNV